MSKYEVASHSRIESLQACKIPLQKHWGRYTVAHTTKDMAFYGFPKCGFSTIRDVVRLLHGTEGGRACDPSCVKASKRRRILFARNPIDRFVSGWCESERVCSFESKKSNNYTFGSQTWALQNWGNWHILSNSSRHATGIKSMSRRAQERFNAFVQAFFKWAGDDISNPRTFPEDSGMCLNGINRLRGHLMSQIQYTCSTAVQGKVKTEGEICGGDFSNDYMGNVETMSSELFGLTGVDPVKEALYSRASRQQWSNEGTSLNRSHIDDPQVPRVPHPSFPRHFFPALCALYRDDFCCLGFPTPKECSNICSEPPEWY